MRVCVVPVSRLETPQMVSSQSSFYKLACIRGKSFKLFNFNNRKSQYFFVTFRPINLLQFLNKSVLAA